MPQERFPSTGSTNLRIGAAVARIEGLYAALRITGPGARRNRLMTELEDAARWLAAVTKAAKNGGAPVPHSRRARRRAMAARGAAWIIARTERRAASADPAARGRGGPEHGPSVR